MVFTPASTASLFCFVLILISVVTMFFLATAKVTPREQRPKALALHALGLTLFLGAVSAMVASGWLAAEPWPRILVFMGVSNVTAVLYALSPQGRRLSLGLPIAALVGFQAFRLPLELVLHAWVKQGTIPETMTWSGQNWDIVSGGVALLLAPFANRSRALAWVANAVGIVLLLNVGRVAVLSSPVPFAWPLEQPLLLGFYLPYALIVPICVAGALAGHIVLTRALLTRK